MGWLEREWREIVTIITRRIGPKQRPFGEVIAYGIAFFLAMFWLILRWDWVTSFG
jgi:hypothetical protein